MGRAATRKRKERFIASFDSLPGYTAQYAVIACIKRHGLDWLTDEQLAEITSRVVDDARFSQRIRVRNRRVISADLRRAS